MTAFLGFNPTQVSSALNWFKETEAFWIALQGTGTVVAAVAAIWAIWIAKSQLAELTSSNKLLAESNEAMVQSNISVVRPYVDVDFELRPAVGRDGSVWTTSVSLRIKNIGRTAARNLRLTIEPSFPAPNDPHNPNWAASVAELNRITNGETIIDTLSIEMPLRFYVSQSDEVMKDEQFISTTWRVDAVYEDLSGNRFVESTVLGLSHLRMALMIADPMDRIAKGIQNIADKLPK